MSLPLTPAIAMRIEGNKIIERMTRIMVMRIEE